MTFRERLLAATYGVIDRISDTFDGLVLRVKTGIQRIGASLRRTRGEFEGSGVPGTPEILVCGVIDLVNDTFDDIVCRAKGGVQHMDLSLCEAGGAFRDAAQAEPGILNQDLKEAGKEVSTEVAKLLYSLFIAHMNTGKAVKASAWTLMKDGKLSLKQALYGGGSVIAEIAGFNIEKAVLNPTLAQVVAAALVAGFAVVVFTNWKPVWEAVCRCGAALTHLRRAVLAKLGFYVIEPTLPVPEITRSWATATFNSNITYTWGYNWA